MARRARWALLGLAALIVGAVVASRIQGGGPGSRSAGEAPAASSELLPASERPPAPDFVGLEGWLNTRPLSLRSLRGRVVLVDFWTYSCVNCVRTIPHLQALERRYGDRGLTIVGVHSPEFDFEKERANVAGAVSRLGVTWPVALDPAMATWNAYKNNVWPAEYLLDRQGRLSYRHLGEGDYEATATAVASLLSAPAPGSIGVPDDTPSGAQTPELYAGSERGRLADGEDYAPAGTSRDYPDRGPPSQRDSILLVGSWADQRQYVTATSPGHVRLTFHAQRLLVVAGPDSSNPLTVTVSVDGRPPPGDQRGSALGPGGFTVGRNDLYPLLAALDPGHHTIDLTVPAGFRLYTFTFG